MKYYLYILQCNDATLYTGITTDLNRRIKEHNTSQKGAKYTKTRRPVKVVYQEELEDKSSALKREYKVKKLSRKEKLELIKKEKNLFS